MTAFSTSFGRLPSMRRRESKNKPVKPIDVDAAQQYVDAGPSSAASTTLLTPRPHHYRSTSPSPATPSASTFGSARIVSSPTFVSSSALATSASFYGAELTPPLSPVHPNSAAAAQATKSPLRRALSRTFFFGNANSSSSASANASPNNPTSQAPHSSISAPILTRPKRPARPARPATSPNMGLSPQPDSFGFAAPSMTRSYTSAPLIAIHDEQPATTNTTRRRSSTLMPSSADVQFSRTPSPIPQATTPTSPRTSLRSIRQMHARKSIQSIFRPWSPLPADAVADADAITPKPAAPIPLPRTSSFRRLSRRASEESFRCRGNAFDGPPAADPRPSVPDVHALGFYSCPPLYSSSCPSASTDVHGPGSHRMNRFTLASYHQAAAPQTRDDGDDDEQLTGLGLVDTLPAAPKVQPKRLSATSQFSSTDSSVSVASALVPSSSASSLASSSASLHSADERASWSHVPAVNNWFSACPPTPPSSIRLQLEFTSLPPASPALLPAAAATAAAAERKPRPLSSIFISSNSSVLDLKEAIAARMAEQGFRLSPKNLTLTLHLQDDARMPSTALGLCIAHDEKQPAKVLDDSNSLLFEEGAQEEDLVVVDCDPSHILWSI
ncbi:uncharacterized protein PSANT_04925 [Moesziomyces antarcticus]|uniref:Uncharacterized protein n=3 Tax=Pseudozyma antarctica TaxID=84753 RepID=A0A5C3FUM2_PSEA2|nr:uncharacterized protein PSANT_04925 [Moesziomyces antarcticus]